VAGLAVLDAARGVRDHQLSYWDVLIWATAHLNQIPVLLTEHFGPSTVIEGGRIVNPFSPDFRLEDWV